MTSTLFTGRVVHARSWPVRHRFSYPVYFYAFDIDELDELDGRVLLFGHNRVRPVALHDRDYLFFGTGSLREKLAALLRAAGHEEEPREVLLVTSARVMHYVFNPASFFFCYGRAAGPECVVAQVNNTFGEMHAYVLDDLMPARRGGEAHYRAAKVFHVSPFFDRVGIYDFYLSDVRRGELDIIIHYSQGDRLVFAARLTGTPAPLERWTVAKKLLRHPFTASLTKPRIFWQAAQLRFARRLPVYQKPPPSDPMTIRAAPPDIAARLGRILFKGFLARIARGGIAVTFPEGRTVKFGKEDGPQASLRIVDNAFFRKTLFHGGIGFGESYVAGEWNTDDLAGTLALLAENLGELKEKHLPLSILGRASECARHLLRPQTVKGSRRNIAAHYDLGNDFFALFLDRTMTYSCGLYRQPGTTLEEAQKEKLRTVIRKADITSGDHVLEIGCGWGSFAVEAARTTGCRVTGITISKKQLELARERVRQAGLEGLVDLQLRDYRHVRGIYDKVVSIEMLEAVGHGRLGTWFAVCERALKPGGRAVVQVITMPHERYREYRHSSDWIRKHIFPGGHLPSLEAIREAAEKHSSLTLSAVEDIGSHYARTLRDWDGNLKGNLEGARALGCDEPFLRKWEYYFAYCRAGFETGAIDDKMIVLEKPPGPGKG